MPSTRMSLMTKGSKACAGVAWRVMSSAAARSQCMKSAADQAVDVVVESKSHQREQQRHTDVLTDLDGPVRNRATFENLEHIVHQVPAIQQRDRQQIEHAEADADQRQEQQVRGRAALRG